MREGQARSLFSLAFAGKSTSKEGYLAYLIGKCVEDIDSAQKDVHLKTDQEPAMIACQARAQQAWKITPSNSPVGDHQANGRAEKVSKHFRIWQIMLDTLFSYRDRNAGSMSCSSEG